MKATAKVKVKAPAFVMPKATPKKKAAPNRDGLTTNKKEQHDPTSMAIDFAEVNTPIRLAHGVKTENSKGKIVPQYQFKAIDHETFDSMDDLADWLPADAGITEKADLPLFVIGGLKDKDDQTKDKRGNLHTRTQANMAPTRVLVFDIDGMSNAACKVIRSKLNQVSAISYTTMSDKKSGLDDRRLRVMVELKHAVKSTPAGKGLASMVFVNWLMRQCDAQPTAERGVWVRGEKTINFDQTAIDPEQYMIRPHAESNLVSHYGEPFDPVPHVVDYVASQTLKEWGTTGKAIAKNRVIRKIADHKLAQEAKDVADWCEAMGFDKDKNNAYIIDCPNNGNHSEDTDGENTTVILLPDASNPEVRINCKHDSCNGNHSMVRNQRLSLMAVGLPRDLLPRAHNINLDEVKDSYNDVLPAGESLDVLVRDNNDTAREQDSEGRAECTDFDLSDARHTILPAHFPVIENLLNFQSTFAMIGESNIGKSFFTLGMMARVSQGHDFAGLRTVGSHVFYITGEGAGGLKRRKEGYELEYNEGQPLTRLHMMPSAGIDLADAESVNRFIGKLQSTAEGEPIGMIVFDSYNTVMAQSGKPFNENDAGDAGRVAVSMQRIAEKCGAATGIVHHPAKGGKDPRGSGALFGALDFSFLLEQPNDQWELNLYHTKSRDGGKQSPRGFRMQIRDLTVNVADDAEIEALLGTISGRPEVEGALPFKLADRNSMPVLVDIALVPFGDSKQKKTSKATDADLADGESKAAQRAELPQNFNTQPMLRFMPFMESLPAPLRQDDGTFCDNAGNEVDPLDFGFSIAKYKQYLAARGVSSNNPYRDLEEAMGEYHGKTANRRPVIQKIESMYYPIQWGIEVAEDCDLSDSD